MSSKLEKQPDAAIVKYLKYVHNIIGDEDISNPEDILFHPEIKKLFAPIGSDYNRLDCEYLFMLIRDNPFYFKQGIKINRPVLEDVSVTYTLRERQWVNNYYNGNILTYVSDSLDTEYLETLKTEDEIDPWGWNYESEVDDSDIIDDSWSIN